MNTLAVSYITQLPQYTSNARELQLSIQYWQQMYAEAGSQKEQAWRMYDEAIDDECPKHMINDLRATAKLFDDICRDTWDAWEQAKAEYLQLFN